jgi:hypothetical protein
MKLRTSKGKAKVEEKARVTKVNLYVPYALEAFLPSSTSSFDAQHPNLMTGQPLLSIFCVFEKSIILRLHPGS